MKIAYWVVETLMSILYLYAGGKKVTQSKAQLAPLMEWVDTVPMIQVRLIGVIEIVGVIGLVLPPLTGIAPVLAVVAAAGLLILQVFATRLHLMRGEGVQGIGINLVLIGMSMAAIWLATAF